MSRHTHVGLGRPLFRTRDIEADLPALRAHLSVKHDVPASALEGQALPKLAALHRSFSGLPMSAPFVTEPSPGPSTRWRLYPEHGAAFALIGGRLYTCPLRATNETDSIQGPHVRAMDLRDAFEVPPDARGHFHGVERDLFIAWLREYEAEPEVVYVVSGPGYAVADDDDDFRIIGADVAPEPDEEADRAEAMDLRRLDDERGK